MLRLGLFFIRRSFTIFRLSGVFSEGIGIYIGIRGRLSRVGVEVFFLFMGNNWVKVLVSRDLISVIF